MQLPECNKLSQNNLNYIAQKTVKAGHIDILKVLIRKGTRKILFFEIFSISTG
jgi:hypothetical protein